MTMAPDGGSEVDSVEAGERRSTGEGQQTGRRARGERPDRAEGAEATAAEWLRTLGITHRHDPLTTSLVFVAALLLSNYAGWLVADLDIGFWTFAVGSLVATWGLYRQPARRDVAVSALRTLAVLLVLTPIAIDITFLIRAVQYGVADPWSFVTTPADLLYLVVFAVFAAIPWGLAYWLDAR